MLTAPTNPSVPVEVRGNAKVAGGAGEISQAGAQRIPHAFEPLFPEAQASNSSTAPAVALPVTPQVIALKQQRWRLNHRAEAAGQSGAILISLWSSQPPAIGLWRKNISPMARGRKSSDSFRRQWLPTRRRGK